MQLESSLIQLVRSLIIHDHTYIEKSLIEIESSLIELKSSLIELKSSNWIKEIFDSIRELFKSIRELFNTIIELFDSISALSNYTYIEKSLIELKSSLIELKSSLIELKRSLIELKSSFYWIRELCNSIRDLSISIESSLNIWVSVNLAFHTSRPERRAFRARQISLFSLPFLCFSPLSLLLPPHLPSLLHCPPPHCPAPLTNALFFWPTSWIYTGEEGERFGFCNGKHDELTVTVGGWRHIRKQRFVYRDGGFRQGWCVI